MLWHELNPVPGMEDAACVLSCELAVLAESSNEDLRSKVCLAGETMRKARPRFRQSGPERGKALPSGTSSALITAVRCRFGILQPWKCRSTHLWLPPHSAHSCLRPHFETLQPTLRLYNLHTLLSFTLRLLNADHSLSGTLSRCPAAPFPSPFIDYTSTVGLTFSVLN